MNDLSRNSDPKTDALDALLAKHFDERELVGYPKTGGINRGWYKEALKIGRVTSAIRSVFDHYDQLAADAMKVDVSLTDRVRKYIVAAQERRKRCFDPTFRISVR